MSTFVRQGWQSKKDKKLSTWFLNDPLSEHKMLPFGSKSAPNLLQNEAYNIQNIDCYHLAAKCFQSAVEFVLQQSNHGPLPFGSKSALNLLQYTLRPYRNHRSRPAENKMYVPLKEEASNYVPIFFYCLYIQLANLKFKLLFALDKMWIAHIRQSMMVRFHQNWFGAIVFILFVYQK